MNGKSMDTLGGMNMASAASYIPKEEDFQLASAELFKETEKEAVSGGKYDFLKRFWAQKSAIAGLIILLILVFLSLVGPYLTGHGYDSQNLPRANMAPRVPILESLGILDGSEILPKTSGSVVVNKYREEGLIENGTYYLFGTDALGRDLFSRCFMGLRISLFIALVATLSNLLIGMNYGMISGYFGGITDILMQRVSDIINSIPTLVVVTLLMLILKPGIWSIIIALMLSGWIQMSRITRVEVLKAKEMEYVQAARTMGASHLHIMFREIAPNIIGKLMTQIMLGIPSAVFLEAFLSFVGLGMPAGTCSLGLLLSEGFSQCLLHPYKLVFPALIMILLMVGCHLVADGIKNASD